LLPPIVSPAARTVEEMTAFVSAGRGRAITSASVAESAANPAIRFVTIEDLPPVKLGLARLRDDERPRVLRFVEAATAVGAGIPGQGVLPSGASDSVSGTGAR
jgi:hypothetical protein